MRRGRIGAIDKYGAGERHEPAEKGHEAKGAFGGHAAVRWEDGTEEEDVELGLMVPNQHARSRTQVLLPGHDLEMDARGPSHGVVKGSGYGPLADAVLADEAQGEGGEDTIGSAEDEAAVGGEEAGVERGRRDGEVGESEEGAGEAGVEGEEAAVGLEDGVHCWEEGGWCEDSVEGCVEGLYVVRSGVGVIATRRRNWRSEGGS